MHKKDLGTLGETLVIAQLLENNIEVFTSVGDNSKIDLIANSNNQLHRIQVKTKTREKNSLECTVLYTRKAGPNYRYKYETSDVDWFAVVDIVTHKIAWIKSSVVNTHDYVLQLRHSKPKNNQTKNIIYFNDFEKIPF